MSQELLYTSAPNGLKPGSRGFCTVLSTQGMPAPLATAVEGLSGYRPVFSPSDERARQNPVVFAHFKLQAAGKSWHVLSRVSDYALDYSGRPNKLAHHVIIDKSSERLSAGPAALLAQPGFMRTEWQGEPKVVALKPVTREPEERTGICVNWQAATGDAGWAGVIAESFLANPDRLVIVLFQPGQSVLPLFEEAVSLLPPDKRWNVTFSTYFTGLLPGTTCNWRGILSDTKEATDSKRFVDALRIDLNQPPPFPEGTGELVEAARTGVRPRHALLNLGMTISGNVPSQGDVYFESVNEDLEPLAEFDGKRARLVSAPPQRKLKDPPRLAKRTRPKIWRSLLMIAAASVSILMFVGYQRLTTTKIVVVEDLNSKTRDAVDSTAVNSSAPPPIAREAQNEQGDVAATGMSAGGATDEPPASGKGTEDMPVESQVLAGSDSRNGDKPNQDNSSGSSVSPQLQGADERHQEIDPRIVFEQLGVNTDIVLISDVHFKFKDRKTFFDNLFELNMLKPDSVNSFKSKYTSFPPLVSVCVPSFMVDIKISKPGSKENKQLRRVYDGRDEARDLFFVTLNNVNKDVFSYGLQIKSGAEILQVCAFDIVDPNGKGALLRRVFFVDPRKSQPDGQSLLDGVKFVSAINRAIVPVEQLRASFVLNSSNQLYEFDSQPFRAGATGSEAEIKLSLPAFESEVLPICKQLGIKQPVVGATFKALRPENANDDKAGSKTMVFELRSSMREGGRDVLKSVEEAIISEANEIDQFHRFVKVESSKSQYAMELRDKCQGLVGKIVKADSSEIPPIELERITELVNKLQIMAAEERKRLTESASECEGFSTYISKIGRLLQELSNKKDAFDKLRAKIHSLKLSNLKVWCDLVRLGANEPPDFKLVFIDYHGQSNVLKSSAAEVPK